MALHQIGDIDYHCTPKDYADGDVDYWVGTSATAITAINQNAP